MRITRLIGSYQDESLDKYLEFKNEFITGFRFSSYRQKASEALINFVEETRHDSFSEYNSLSFEIKSRRMFSKNPILYHANLIIRVENSFDEYRGPSIVRDFKIHSSSLEKKDSKFEEMAKEMDRFQRGFYGHCSITIRSENFTEGRRELEERHYLKEDSTEDYVHLLLDPENIQRQLAGYPSTSELYNRLSLWGVDSFHKLYFKDFGLTSVREIENFVSNLSKWSIPNERLFD